MQVREGGVRPESILYRYGRLYPAWEHELDAEHRRTGRKRKRAFVSYPRPWDPKPIIVWEFA